MSWRDEALIDHQHLVTSFPISFLFQSPFFPLAESISQDTSSRIFPFLHVHRENKTSLVVTPGEIMVVQRPPFHNGIHTLPLCPNASTSLACFAQQAGFPKPGPPLSLRLGLYSVHLHYSPLISSDGPVDRDSPPHLNQLDRTLLHILFRRRRFRVVPASYSGTHQNLSLQANPSVPAFQKYPKYGCRGPTTSQCIPYPVQRPCPQ